MEFRRALPKDFSTILQLQAASFIDNLSAEERRGGFLSVQFTLDQLADMTKDIGIVVAFDQGSVVGYMGATRCDVNPQPPIVTKMIEQFDGIEYQGKPLRSYRSFIYGPVCIDGSRRRRGLLLGLYETLKKEVEEQFELGVAFVDKENSRSLRAHADGLVMDPVGEFEWNGKGYVILAFRVASKAS